MNRTLFIIAAASLALAACSSEPVPVPVPENLTPEQVVEFQQQDAARMRQESLNVRFEWTDPLTGCDYINPSSYDSYGSMGRMDRDGYHVYCADQKARDGINVTLTNANIGERFEWTDPVTGCDYINPSGYDSYGSAPRIDRDGFSTYCAEQKERDRLEAAGLPVPEAPAE